MWMQLASRALSSVARTNKGIQDTESQAMVQEPIVVLPLSTDDDDDDDAACVSKSVHLVNPSMNTLMQIIDTSNQKPALVSVQKSQAQQDGFKSLDNESLPDSIAFMHMVGGMEGQHRHQMGINYYSHYDLSLSVQEICGNVSPTYLHRALSLDDLSHNFKGVPIDGSFSSEEPLLWRVHSEGSLITMPGDGNLAQQMAILQPAYEEILMQSGAGKAKKRARRRTLRKRRNADLETSDLSALLSPERLNFSYEELEAPLPTHNVNLGYWISLAHLLVVVACLRGGL